MHAPSPHRPPKSYHHEGNIYAALDLGTNNCRLLVAKTIPSDDNKPHIKVIDSFSKIVRLGEGLSKHSDLQEDAIRRTISALKQCKRKLDKYDISSARFVATEACRQARNSDDFLQRVHDQVGIDIEIISNEDEASLAFMGCSTLLKENTNKAIVFDIGGGSTEFMWVDRSSDDPQIDNVQPQRVQDWLSMAQGVMNLSEKFGGNAFAEIYFNEMVSHLVERIRPFDAKNDITTAIERGEVQMLSTSGTVTTLAAIYLGLKRYERSKVDGITLAIEDLRMATQTILKMRASERFSHACIGPDRSDYIVSGCAIFEAVCSLWPVDSITIADRGVREGIIMSLLEDDA